MIITNHAQARGQQRGISDLYITLLYAYGNEEIINDSRHFSFDKHQKKRLRKAINKLKENLDKDIYLVVNKENDAVITVAHKL